MMGLEPAFEEELVGLLVEGVAVGIVCEPDLDVAALLEGHASDARLVGGLPDLVLVLVAVADGFEEECSEEVEVGEVSFLECVVFEGEMGEVGLHFGLEQVVDEFGVLQVAERVEDEPGGLGDSEVEESEDVRYEELDVWLGESGLVAGEVGLEVALDQAEGGQGEDAGPRSSGGVGYTCALRGVP